VVLGLERIKMRKKITIEIDEDIDAYVSDILCWLYGYLSGKKDEYLRDYNLLNPAIDKLKELNCKLKDELKKCKD